MTSNSEIEARTEAIAAIMDFLGQDRFFKAIDGEVIDDAADEAAAETSDYVVTSETLDDFYDSGWVREGVFERVVLLRRGGRCLAVVDYGQRRVCREHS